MHILGIQLGIALLLLAGHVHGHELDLDVAEALGQSQPEQVHGARSGPGPGERVVAIRVANYNRLDGHAGKEGAQLEAYQRLAVRAGALGEDEQRWPVVGGIGTVLDRLDCRVARVGVFATHVDRLREVNDLWKERKRWSIKVTERENKSVSLPKNGKQEVSALATTDGGPKMTATSESKKDE